MSQVFLKGDKVHYLLTGHQGNPALHEILSSLLDTKAFTDFAKAQGKK